MPAAASATGILNEILQKNCENLSIPVNVPSDPF